jgi:hypothetical protein
MGKNIISFSSDGENVSKQDIEETQIMSEEYFTTKKDPRQFVTSTKNRDWIYRNGIEHLNIIRNKGKIIGYAFMLPCNIDSMKEFITKKIDEATLFEKVRKIKLKKVPETIYLCASIVNKEFRG